MLYWLVIFWKFRKRFRKLSQLLIHGALQNRESLFLFPVFSFSVMPQTRWMGPCFLSYTATNYFLSCLEAGYWVTQKRIFLPLTKNCLFVILLSMNVKFMHLVNHWHLQWFSGCFGIFKTHRRILNIFGGYPFINKWLTWSVHISFAFQSNLIIEIRGEWNNVNSPILL